MKNSSPGTHALPLIYKNHIESSTQNGVVCEGLDCFPVLKCNMIELNRKAGIRCCEEARAHIGGDIRHVKGLSDLECDRKKCLDYKQHNHLYETMFEDTIGGSYNN